MHNLEVKDHLKLITADTEVMRTRAHCITNFCNKQVTDKWRPRLLNVHIYYKHVYLR
uniref:Uncharacterized protein n=1 Tax=Arundo donax TaxID=35708 RepID=A0A0A8ZJ91_ARUDO